jgi:hypothetical protein
MPRSGRDGGRRYRIEFEGPSIRKIRAEEEAATSAAEAKSTTTPAKAAKGGRK